MSFCLPARYKVQLSAITLLVSCCVYVWCFVAYLWFGSESLSQYVLSLMMYLSCGGIVIGLYFLTARLREVCGIGTPGSAEPGRVLNRMRNPGLLIVGVTAIHLVLSMIVVYNPSRSFISSDSFFYGVMIDMFGLGKIPYLHFPFPYPPSVAALFFTMKQLSINTSLEVSAFFAVISTINVVLVYALVKRLNASFAIVGTVFYALLPLNLIEIAGNGHMDALLVTIILVGMLLFHEKHHFLASMALVIAFYFKPYVFIIAPLLATYLYLRGNWPQAKQDMGNANSIFKKLKVLIKTDFIIFTTPWIGFVAIPILAASFIFPSIVQTLFNSQLIRGNETSFPSRFSALHLALFGNLYFLIACAGLIIVIILVIRNRSPRNGGVGHRSKIIPFRMIVYSLPFICVIVLPSMFTLFAILIMFFLILAPVLIRDERRKTESMLVVSRFISISLILNGLSWLLINSTFTNTDIASSAIDSALILIMNPATTRLYTPPILSYIIGISITVLGFVLLSREKDTIDPTVHEPTQSAIFFKIILAQVLLFMASGLYYPWYMLWFIPFFIACPIKKKGFIKICFFAFLITAGTFYPANDSENYEPPSTVLFTSSFSVADGWIVTTNVVNDSVCNITQGNGLSIKLNWSNYPDVSSSFFEINKSLGPILIEEGMRLKLAFKNATHQSFSFQLSLKVRFTDASEHDVILLATTSRYYWTANEAALLLLSIPREMHVDQMVKQVSSIVGINLKLHAFSVIFGEALGEINNYEAGFNYISIFKVNPFIF